MISVLYIYNNVWYIFYIIFIRHSRLGKCRNTGWTWAVHISEEFEDGDHIRESIDTVSIGRGSVVRTIKKPQNDLYSGVFPPSLDKHLHDS